MVDSKFGETVRRARQAHGWNQEDLAKRVGMSQRAVSNWERGVAEPDDAVKDRVLDALGVRDPAAAGASRAEPTHPGRALISELPFEWLSPGDFEEFTADLLAVLNPGAFVSRVGKTGHAQGGYDVHVESSGKLVLGVQCKREAQFGPKKVSDAVDEARKAVTERGAESVGSSVIVLSRIASPDTRKEMRKHQGWELWDRNDLSRKVRGLDPHLSVPIVKRFFPTMLADFLGISRPGPWLDAEEYIDRWYTDKIYTHRWRLVGSSDAVDTLAGFAARGEGLIMLLTGPGGSGKTKILTELCRRASDGGIAVRVLEPDSSVESDSFEQLPGSGALVVIIDDAHDEDVPVGRIIAGVQHRNPQANVVVSLRRYGLPRVRAELRRVGCHTGETPEVKVPELDLESATQLAYEVLDEPVRHHGLRLAAAARDCPLLIVTGAALVNRGELDPGGFEDDQRLHVELTDRLAEALTAQSPAEGPARRKVLTALAAYQPVDLADGQTRASLEKLTSLEFAVAASHVSGLEDAGLVLRRGTVVRVVPDLLGDALLNQAARNRGSGVPTGYLDKALSSARGAAVRNLIINAGRVDWQAGGTGPDGAGLIGPLWDDLDAAFRNSDANDRTDMLELIAKVAFFQPRRALDMVRWAMANPAEQASKDVGYGHVRTNTDADVRHALPPVLRPIAWYSELFPQAAELLWDLAVDDEREPHQFPDHPRRVLQELASFTRQGATGHQRTLVGLVDRWLNRYQGSGNRSPLMVLGPLLATSGHDEEWTPDTLVFRPYTLLPTHEVLQLRDAVLEIAFAQLGTEDLAWAAAAIAMIGAGITLMPPAFGGQFDEQVKQDWHAHFADILDRLRGHLARTRLAPALLVDIRSRLQWTGEYGPEQLRRTAQAIVGSMPVTPENTLARALHGGPVDPIAAPDLETRSRLQQNLFTGAIEAIADWPDEQAAEKISALLADEQRVFGPDTGRARPFLWDLIIARPSLGAAMCAHAVSAPDSTLGPQMSITLIAMGKAEAPETIDRARQLLASGRIDLAREVGHALGLQRSRADLLAGEAELLRELAGHPDPVVAAATVGAVRYLATGYPDLALDLVFTALPNGGLREAVANFGPQPYGTLSWAQLPAERKSLIIGQLAECDSLDEYEIGQFLAHIAAQEPDSIVELLLTRVERAEQGMMLSPLPHTPYDTLPFRDSARFPDLLRRIREWLAAAPQSSARAYLGGNLFALVAGEFDDQVLDVVYDYTDAPDPVKMRVAATMLRKAPRQLVWNVEAVRRMLRAADRCGTDSLRAVHGALIGAASRGGRSAMVGQPFAEDVELRDRSETLAAACLPGSVEEQFYSLLAESARRNIAWTVEDVDRPDDRRSWS